MSTIVRQDPFARAGLRRERYGPGQCAWCGQSRPRLYTYQVETDAERQPILGQPFNEPFCNLECFASYQR